MPLTNTEEELPRVVRLALAQGLSQLPYTGLSSLNVQIDGFRENRDGIGNVRGFLTVLNLIANTQREESKRSEAVENELHGLKRDIEAVRRVFNPPYQGPQAGAQG